MCVSMPDGWACGITPQRVVQDYFFTGETLAPSAVPMVPLNGLTDQHKLREGGMAAATRNSAVAGFRQETRAEWTAADRATDDHAGPGQTGAGTGPPRGAPASPAS